MHEEAEQDYMKGMSYKEISEKYAVTINTVKSWKTRYKWQKGVQESVQSKPKSVQKSSIKKCAKKSVQPVKKSVQSYIKPGQPTKYKDEYADQYYGYCMLGYTDAECADKWGVSEATVNNWKLEHKEFLEFGHLGRDDADVKSVKSLFKRANGYTKKVTKVFCYKGEVVTADIEEEVEPDTKALQLWLAARQARLWRINQNSLLDEDGALHIIVAAPAAANAWLSKPVEPEPINVTPENDEEDDDETV